MEDRAEDEDLEDTDFEEWKRKERERRRNAKEDRKRRSIDRDEALAKLRQAIDIDISPASTPSLTPKRAALARKEGGKREKEREKGREKNAEGEGNDEREAEDNDIININNDGEEDEDGRRVVKLNIGGRKYVTTVKTLRGQGKEINYFTALLGDQFAPPETDEKGYHFIDRNGSLFEPILDYLRTGKGPPDSLFIH